MLCQKCGLKEAVVPTWVCVVNDKQIDKWLCSDCVEELATSRFLLGNRFQCQRVFRRAVETKS